MIEQALQRISGDRMRSDLLPLSREPLPFRTANHTRPGQQVDSLTAADAHIRGQLQAAGREVVTTVHRLQALRRDSTKPLHHGYCAPAPEDPAYDATTLEATRQGAARADEFVQLVAHQDSMSWIDSPGAHDNATGTVVNLELARVLATCDPARSVGLQFRAGLASKRSAP